jgi:ABC-2 type transport system permease protein
MSTATIAAGHRWWRALSTLVWLSFRRQLWSANTLMVTLPLAACVGYTLLRRRELLALARFEPAEAFDRFSTQVVIAVFASFVVPICAVAYATTSIREDRTLLFLLVRPVPRWLVLLAKVAATLPLVVGVSVGGLWVCCAVAGPVGGTAFRVYLPAVFCMALAYAGLFHLFAVALRHSTIAALVYALFVETLLGNLPGIIKQVAVNFYGRSMMYAVGQPEGLVVRGAWIEPVSGRAGALVLLAIAAVGLALAVAVFARREYRDLT